MNINELKVIINTTRESIAKQDFEYDYLGEAQSINHDDGEFWFYYSQALRTLPASSQMDLRENGAIATAVYASSKCYNFSPDIPATSAEKILSLEMLVHGLSARLNLGLNPQLNCGSTTKEWFLNSLGDLRSAIKISREKFPQDEWFKECEVNLNEEFDIE